MDHGGRLTRPHRAEKPIMSTIMNAGENAERSPFEARVANRKAALTPKARPMNSRSSFSFSRRSNGAPVTFPLEDALTRSPYAMISKESRIPAKVYHDNHDKRSPPNSQATRRAIPARG